jgi:anti-sigma28 factor (negative regulator of flagellin synthesis)
MRNQGNTTPSLSGPSAPQRGTISVDEIKKAQARWFHIDQISSSRQLREINHASQILAHTLEIRETIIVALRKDIESGYYSIKAGQVAEKIMKDHLMDLLHF